MPTYERLARFKRAYRRLTPEQEARLRTAVGRLVGALSAAPPALPGEPLVKAISGHPGVFELRFSPDGRATFTLEPPQRNDLPHVVWRRIGGHGVLSDP